MNVLISLCSIHLIGGYIALVVALLPLLFVGITDSTIVPVPESLSTALGGTLVLVWNYFILRKRGLNIVTPFIPIPFWLIGIIWVFISTWHSYDTLQISYFDANNTPFTIESVEKNGVGDKRFVNITNGTFSGNYVYEYNKKTNHVNSIVYPIISHEQEQNALTKPIDIKVMVKQSADTTEEGLDKWIEEQEIVKKSSNIKGIVKIGLNSLDDKTKELIQSSTFHLQDNFIFIEEGKAPDSLIVSATSLVISIIGIILSFVALYMKIKVTD